MKKYTLIVIIISIFIIAGIYIYKTTQKSQQWTGQSQQNENNSSDIKHIKDGFASDGKFYYYIFIEGMEINPTARYEIIKNADYDSFQILRFGWAKDKNNVFYENNIVDDLDAGTFQYFDNFDFAKDKNGIYWMHVSDKTQIQEADIDTFQPIGESLYAKDKNNVYRANKIISSADPGTFEVINQRYTKDKNNVYKVGKKMEGVNSETFNPDE